MKMFTLFLRAVLRKTGLINKFYHAVNRVYFSIDYLHPFNLLALAESFQITKDREWVGDYYEFGMYTGFSFSFAYHLGNNYVLKEGKDMKFWGFDSFDGLPEPKGIDKLPDRFRNFFVRGHFAVSIDLVKRKLEKNKVDLSKVMLIKGYYEDILNDKLFLKYSFKKASVILIDCDLYSSTAAVLKFVTRLLGEGTIILFDDYYLTNEDGGQQLALKEWVSLNKNIQLGNLCEYGLLKGFIVNKI